MQWKESREKSPQMVIMIRNIVIQRSETARRNARAGTTRFQTCQPKLIYGVWDARATDSSKLQLHNQRWQTIQLLFGSEQDPEVQFESMLPFVFTDYLYIIYGIHSFFIIMYIFLLFI